MPAPTEPMPKANNKRKYRLRQEQEGGEYGAWIRRQPCYVTGRDPGEGGEIVAAHVVHTRGAGGKAWDQVPLHRLVEADWHSMVDEVFTSKYGISKQRVREAAAEYWRVWQSIQAGEEHLPFTHDGRLDE